MTGDFNINVYIKKLPEKWWFWVLVALFASVILMSNGKIATGIVVFLIAVGVGSAIINLILPTPYPALWAVCGISLLFALLFGIAFVSDEWKLKTSQIPQIPILTKTILLA